MGKEVISGGLVLIVLAGVGFMVMNTMSGAQKLKTANALASKMVRGEHLQDDTAAAVATAAGGGNSSSSSSLSSSQTTDQSQQQASTPQYQYQQPVTQQPVQQQPSSVMMGTQSQNMGGGMTGTYTNNGQYNSGGQQYSQPGYGRQMTPQQQQQSRSETDQAFSSMGQ
jgi:hypothetical protein